MIYTIEKETLTALGDAIREKSGELKTLYNQPAIYDFSHNWTTGQWVGQNTNNTTTIDIGEASKVLIKDIVITANNPDAIVFYNLYLSQFDTYNSTGEYQYGVETNPTEIICNTPTVIGEKLWFGTRCSTQSTTVSITATIVHLDANGEVLMNKTVEVLNTMTPMQMAEEINKLPIMTENKLAQLVERNIQEVTAEDLGNILKVGTEAFYQCGELISVELPETVQSIGQSAFIGCSKLIHCKLPQNLSSMEGNVFGSCNSLNTLTFGATIPRIQPSTFDGCKCLLYVPGEVFDNYVAAANWGGVYRDRLRPNSPYAGLPLGAAVLEYEGSKTYTIPLTCYDEAPECSVVSSDPTIATATIDSVSRTEITITISALSTEGSTSIAVSIPGANGHTFIRTTQVSVFAELLPPSYTVVAVDGAQYGFALQDDGYYESTNQKVASSYAYCKINISNMMGYPVYIDCISYGENNYDYGLLSDVNTDLSMNNSDGTYLHSFKGKSKPDVQTIEYLNAIGNCYITVKYKKDGSGDNNSDSFKFTVRFGE